MSFDLTIACIDYRDPTFMAALVVCTALFLFGGARLASVLLKRAAGVRMIASLLPVGALLLVTSPLVMTVVVQSVVALTSQGVTVCFHFVRPLLFVPGLASIGLLLGLLIARARKPGVAA